jgi:hypothetical protein
MEKNGFNIILGKFSTKEILGFYSVFFCLAIEPAPPEMLKMKIVDEHAQYNDGIKFYDTKKDPRRHVQLTYNGISESQLGYLAGSAMEILEDPYQRGEKTTEVRLFPEIVEIIYETEDLLSQYDRLLLGAA